MKRTMLGSLVLVSMLCGGCVEWSWGSCSVSHVRISDSSSSPPPPNPPLNFRVN
jgi:hypothetical protein